MAGMSFEEFWKERERMCNSMRGCGHYPLEELRNKTACSFCSDTIIEFPDEAEEIVSNWAHKNPKQTNFEKYKEVLKKVFDIEVCVDDSYCPPWNCKKKCDYCKKWWNEEYKEPTHD